MNLVDTHCHIHSVKGKDDHTTSLWLKLGLKPEEIISRAESFGVNKFICVGTDIADSRLSIEFAAKNSLCYASIGIHPHEAHNFVNASSLKGFEGLLKQKKVVAIGECGLDYFYHHSKPDQQKRLLRFQLDLAVKHNLPVIFHVREAFSDFWPIFDSYSKPIRGVLHSFTDSKYNLEEAIKRGLRVGVNGIATFNKNPGAAEMYRAIPAKLLLLETDAPYLTPTPYRGNINEPKFTKRICEYLAELREEDPNELAAQTSLNAHLLFGL